MDIDNILTKDNKPVIFLDIDGVLNIIGSIYSTQLDSSVIGEPHLIARFNYVCNLLPELDIVISSTRKVDITKLKIDLKECGFNYINKIVGSTPTMEKRGQEIQKYIDEFNIKSYLVLDDNITQINGIDGKFIPAENIIHINPLVGLDEQQAYKIIKYMKK